MRYQVDVNKILNKKQKQPCVQISNGTAQQDVAIKKQITCESLNRYSDYEITQEELHDYLEFQNRAYNMFFDDNDITMEQFVNFTRDCIKFEHIDNIMEAAASRNITRKAEKKLREVNHTINGHKNTAVKNMKRVDDKVSDVANRKLDDIINTGKDLKRDKLLQGRPQLKLSRFIKSSIVTLGGATGAAALFGPAVAAVLVAIGLLCRKELMSRTEKREKQRILLELETDLKLCKEKIEDAKSENDKKKKYQLMRIESSLEKEITRIKYGLRYY